MKMIAPFKVMIPVFLVCCITITGIFALQVDAAAKKPSQPKVQKKKAEKETDGQKLVKVCSLNSVEANREFQKNVQIMQAQRRRVVQLQNELKQARSKTLKKGLEKELELAVKKLEEDNKKMTKAYGFSLNRNYALVTEKASVFMYVSEEEAVKLEAEQKKVSKAKRKK